MKMDEYRFLVKFPPHKKVESKVPGKATYFYLKNETVMASLRVWDGDIEPVGQLSEAWVQIKGVPPKWTDWTTIKEIASSLGKLIEVDWHTLYSSFFSNIRVKINCKDPGKIPPKRVMEMEDQLYMITFKVEGLDQAKEGDGGDKNGDEDDDDESDLLGDDMGKDKGPPKEKTPPGKNDEDIEQPQNGGGKKAGSRNFHSVRKVLLLPEEVEAGTTNGLPSCTDFLKAMEINDSGDEDDDQGHLSEREEEMCTLPEEWTYSEDQVSEHGKEVTEEQGPANRTLGANTRIEEKKKWGPIEVDRRSKRGANDGRTLLEKAHDIKRKWCEGEDLGKNKAWRDVKHLLAKIVGIAQNWQILCPPDRLEELKSLLANLALEARSPEMLTWEDR